MEGVVIAIVGCVVLLLVLISVAALIWRIWAVTRQYHKLNDRTPTLERAPDGWTIDIPVTAVSGVWLSMPGVAFQKSTGLNEFRITPTGIEYRILRRKQVSYAEVTLVDFPTSTFPAYFVVGLGTARGIGVVTTSPEAAHAALVELSQHCRLTPRARRWIGPSPAPPVYAPPPVPVPHRSEQPS